MEAALTWHHDLYTEVYRAHKAGHLNAAAFAEIETIIRQRMREELQALSREKGPRLALELTNVYLNQWRQEVAG